MINSLDGSKLAIVASLFIVLLSVLFIGIHLVIVDGADALAEIAFLEQIIQFILPTAGVISSVHVVTGAVTQIKQTKKQDNE